MLPLPLRHYDDAGRIKPAITYWWVLLWLMRPLALLVLALLLRHPLEQLIFWAYIRPIWFYFASIPLLVAVVCWAISAWRRALWRQDRYWPMALLKGLLPLALLLDATLLVLQSVSVHWQFRWPLAVQLLVTLLLILWWANSRQLRLMLADWRRQ